MSDEHLAIVSVPHTGTNALARHLGIRHQRTPPTGAGPGAPVVIGHVWGRGAKQGYNWAEDWVPLLEYRRVWMPVRDPEQLAYSYQYVRRQGLHNLRSALGEAVKLLKLAPHIERFDIRDIEPFNVRGEFKRDEEVGAELLAEFPTYFEGMY